MSELDLLHAKIDLVSKELQELKEVAHEWTNAHMYNLMNEAPAIVGRISELEYQIATLRDEGSIR